MNASRPEADTEYSRGFAANPGPGGAPRSVRAGGAGGVPRAVAALASVGCAVLIAAEFTPLLHVHTTAHIVVTTVDTGSHNSYALIPIAILAAALAISAWSSGSRLALLAVGILGLVVLGIALLGDLPDAHTRGVVTTSSGLEGASSSLGIGLYLETLGGIILMLTAAGGMLLEPIVSAPRSQRPASGTSRTRSAS